MSSFESILPEELSDPAVRGAEVPEPGAVTIVATVDGYGRRSLEAEIGVEPRTLDIELDPAATLRLHVTDRAGAPVRGKLAIVIVGRDNPTDRAIEISAAR